MIEQIKCECGHANPPNTVLCEACGKPQMDLPDELLLDMRYEGVARKSQRNTGELIDRIWSFFSSVKVAIWLIVICLIGSIFGTILPQESTFIEVDGRAEISPQEYYITNYGTFGAIYFFLGFGHTFTSWWFITLLILIGISLIICSVDRVLPLYHALNKQSVRKHDQFLRRQRINFESIAKDRYHPVWIEQFATLAKKKGYTVHTTEDALLAEKNRFSRWGPYINHIGLIITLLALVFRSIVPEFAVDSYQSFKEGEIVKITNTPYYLKNELFTVEMYEDQQTPKRFQTDAILYRCLKDCDNPNVEPVFEELTRHPIQVNHPLVYDGYSFYQFSYSITPLLRAVTVTLKTLDGQASIGSFRLVTKNPASTYQVGDYQLSLLNYYPDFTLSESKLPVSNSTLPNAPAYVFEVEGPDVIKGKNDRFIYFPLQKDKQNFAEALLNEKMGANFGLFTSGMQDVEITKAISYLNIRTDHMLPYILIGLSVFLLGVIIGLYWQHRRIWLRIEHDHLLLGAHTNKHWNGLRADVLGLLKQSGIDIEDIKLRDGNPILKDPKEIQKHI